MTRRRGVSERQHDQMTRRLETVRRGVKTRSDTVSHQPVRASATAAPSDAHVDATHPVYSGQRRASRRRRVIRGFSTDNSRYGYRRLVGDDRICPSLERLSLSVADSPFLPLLTGGGAVKWWQRPASPWRDTLKASRVTSLRATLTQRRKSRAIQSRSHEVFDLKTKGDATSNF